MYWRYFFSYISSLRDFIKTCLVYLMQSRGGDILVINCYQHSDFTSHCGLDPQSQDFKVPPFFVRSASKKRTNRNVPSKQICSILFQSLKSIQKAPRLNTRPPRPPAHSPHQAGFHSLLLYNLLKTLIVTAGVIAVLLPTAQSIFFSTTLLKFFM